ncbi:MAG: hypothetical protein HY754_15760 [Nitrospirae bacterium]|nr:hypothetical protein [Nitrospirota bacterium]
MPIVKDLSIRFFDFYAGKVIPAVVLAVTFLIYAYILSRIPFTGILNFTLTVIVLTALFAICLAIFSGLGGIYIVAAPLMLIGIISIFIIFLVESFLRHSPENQATL